MIGLIITNILGLLLVFGCLTAIIILYFKEVETFRKKEEEMDKQIKYYIKELEKRSIKEDVNLH
jgi:hypothetical protein